MYIHSSKLIKLAMTSGLKESEHEEVVSLLPDPISGNKGNILSGNSSAAADFSDAVLSIADMIGLRYKRTIPRVTRQDLNWQKPGRHCLDVLAKSKQALQDGTAEIQEDTLSLLERINSNLTVFLLH